MGALRPSAGVPHHSSSRLSAADHAIGPELCVAPMHPMRCGHPTRCVMRIWAVGAGVGARSVDAYVLRQQRGSELWSGTADGELSVRSLHRDTVICLSDRTRPARLGSGSWRLRGGTAVASLSGARWRCAHQFTFPRFLCIPSCVLYTDVVQA